MIEQTLDQKHKSLEQDNKIVTIIFFSKIDVVTMLNNYFVGSFALVLY